MSNETKRDVFEYYLNMIKALKDPLAAECVNEARQRYAAALPDDLPVIPKAVGDDITYAKANGMSIGDVLWRCGEGGMFDCDEVESWINDHSDTFATAWVLGVWRVEETGEIVKLEAGK